MLRATLRMIRFEHSVFALPFALAGAWMAAAGIPPAWDLVWIVAAAVSARSCAMAANRIVDRSLDSENPRTAMRELPRGVLSLRFARGFALVHGVAFVGFAFLLSPLCGWLSFPVLAILVGYSWLKRVTVLSHFGLGLALACAPLGAWLAVSKTVGPGWQVPLWMGLGVALWTAGFDLLYSLQDAEHDRKVGLHSVPARYGLHVARVLALLLHVLALSCWVNTGHMAGRGTAFWFGLVLVAGLLLTQHGLLRGNRLQQIPLAFFRVNAWVGPVFFLGLAGDFSAT